MNGVTVLHFIEECSSVSINPAMITIKGKQTNLISMTIRRIEYAEFNQMCKRNGFAVRSSADNFLATDMIRMQVTIDE